MHILNFKTYYEPENAAGIALDSNTSEDLAARGHNVSVFVPRPSRGVTEEVRRNTPHKEWKFEGRLQIVRYPMFRESRSLFLRTLRFLACSLFQIAIGTTVKKVDLIFVGSTPPFQGLIAVLIKKIRRIPFVYNLQDVFPDSMVSAGLSKKGSPLFKLGTWIANATYRNADEIIVISESMKSNLVGKGVDEKKISVVCNWVDTQIEKPIDRADNALIRELSIPSYGFTVVYAGNIGYAQSVDIVVEAAKLLGSEEGIGFLIFGNGAEADKVKEMAELYSLDNVLFYPLQPYERVSEVYSLGDACLVCCKPGTGASAVPSKTWSIMACGRPVLASFDSGTLIESVLLEEGCGLFSEAGDAVSLAANVKKMATSKGQCVQMGGRARRFVEEKLSRSVCTSEIARIIERAAERDGLR